MAAPWRLRREFKSYIWKGRKWAVLRAWHRFRYGVDVPPSMVARFGRGRFVSVVRRGPYTDLIEHASGDMIRLIPYQPNHGFMVELHTADGHMPWRTHLDFRALRNLGHLGSEQ